MIDPSMEAMAEKCIKFLKAQADAQSGWNEVDDKGNVIGPSPRAARWQAAYDHCWQVIVYFRDKANERGKTLQK